MVALSNLKGNKKCFRTLIILLFDSCLLLQYHYVSPDKVAFFALQRSPVFDAGIDVNRMLVYGHMGPPDLQRNVLDKLAPEQLTSGPMTLWFQQTGPQATEYAIELVFQAAE